MNWHADSLTARDAEIPSLRHVAIMAGLDGAALAGLEAVARYQEYARGALLWPDQPAHDTIFAITRGRMRRFHPASDGRETTLSVIHTGDLFMDGAAQTCVEALDDGTVVCSLPMRHFMLLIAVHPVIARRLFGQLCRRLADAHERIAEVTLYGVKPRLAHTLARLARLDDDRMVGETHAQLAMMIGTRPEEVTRALHDLAARRLIALQPHRHGITVLDLEGLAAF